MLIGTDIIEIERIQAVAQRQSRFAKKVLSEAEYAHYQTLQGHRQQTYLAGRFSAKEAYGKALGSGIETLIKFRDISILPNASGVPQIVAGPITYPQARLSISHSRDYATATVLIEMDEKGVAVAIEQFLQEVNRNA